jgi:hypothetical protein
MLPASVIYIHICLIYISIYAYTYIYIYISTYLYIYMCLCVCVCVFIYIRKVRRLYPGYISTKTSPLHQKSLVNVVRVLCG